MIITKKHLSRRTILRGTVGALLPMAVGLTKGDSANLALARAVIGGLTVSTLFTLFLIPSLYTMFDRWKKTPVADEDA